MKTQVFYVSEVTLLEAIRLLHRNGLKPKDYEYAISIYAKRIFERLYNKTFVITFELNSKHQKDSRSLELTSKETVVILRTHLKEGTEVDFGLAPFTQGSFKGYDYPFQVKRFIGHSANTFLDDLIKFIEKKSRHYRSPKTSLIAIPELKAPDHNNSNQSDLKINIVNFSKELFRTMANKISVDKGYLRSILIFALNKGEPKLTQIWPNYGEYKDR